MIALEDLKENFRCAECGDLYEVEYPAWSAQAGSAAKRMFPNPSALRWLWKERRTSTDLRDQSGVWRFRELLPILRDDANIVSLREGNTPLYALRRAARCNRHRSTLGPSTRA